MQSEKLISVDKIKLKFIDEKFVLPEEIQQGVDKYWEELIKSGRKYFRGEVFTLQSLEKNGNEIKASLCLSDFAHFLYTQNVGLPSEHACVNVHTSCLIETADEIFIFGRMGNHTSRSGKIQCVGGGLDNNDIKEGRIDLHNNIKKELKEEVGIDIDNKLLASTLELKYVIRSSNGNSIAAIFILKLNMTADEFKSHYEKFEEELKSKNELPEFEKIIYLPKRKDAIKEFCQKESSFDHYMKTLLMEFVK